MEVDLIKILLSVILSQVASLIGSIIYGKFLDSWFINLKKPRFSITGKAMIVTRVIVAAVMGVLFYTVWSSEQSDITLFMLIIMLVLMVLGIFNPYVLLVKKSPKISASTQVISFGLTILLTILAYSISSLAFVLSIMFLSWITYLLIITLSTIIMNIK